METLSSAGNEEAFMQLVRAWSPSMIRVACAHVPGHAVAEEVVQETWIAVLRGIDRFEGRSSLRTWVFRILINQAKTRGVAERRTVPFSRRRLTAALSQLPPRQRQVVSLRDFHGYSGADAARVLNVSEINQRVLLHRGRGRLRAAIGDYLAAG